MNYRFRIPFAAALLAATIVACSDSTTEPVDTDAQTTTAVLNDLAYKVILPTYVELDQKAQVLADAVAALQTGITDAKLEAARQAWRDARRPWEQSEGFLFGPVDTKGIDPSIDSWPVNKTDLDAVLASSATLTKEYIDGLEGTQKGFHTIEYLIFGTNGTKPASAMTPREIEYLVAVTQSFKAATAQLRHSWEASGDNFAAQFANAGGTSTIYTSQRSALEDIVGGMAGICDEVANGKINGAFTQQDRTLEESQFSNNSNADFQDNIRSVKNLYMGTYGANSGKGVSQLVAAKNSTLDTRVRAEIDAAIAAIGAMQPSFGEAIFNNKASVTAAQDAVRKLQATFEGEVTATLLP
ncbi:MAG: hypothetical protein DYG96_10520 [Chlorobi bacterium CHB2]|nr:hypothetical protein [Chlorobi bacterium CHB2]